MNYVPDMVLDLSGVKKEVGFKNCIIRLDHILIKNFIYPPNDLWKITVLEWRVPVFSPNYNKRENIYSLGSENMVGATIVSAPKLEMEDVL